MMAGVVADQSAAVAGECGACAVSGGVGVADDAGIIADQSAAVVVTSASAGSIGIGDKAGVEANQSAVVAGGFAARAVPGGVGIGDVTVVGIGEDAVEDADVGNGCRAVYGLEQRWIGLGRVEGDGMIITVEGAAEVGDGCPIRAGKYGDIRHQPIVAGGIRGKVIDQVCGRSDVLADGVRLALVLGIGDGRAVVGTVWDVVVIVIRVAGIAEGIAISIVLIVVAGRAAVVGSIVDAIVIVIVIAGIATIFFGLKT